MDTINTDLAALNRAANLIKQADALLITSGAGMGVDSGLAPFRGPQGLWTGNSPYQKLSVNIRAKANPATFVTDPALAWGFYGYRLASYRAAQPHPGFDILKSWTAQKFLEALTILQI